MRTFRDLPSLENVQVLVRASLNVPVSSGSVVSDYRLRRASSTLKELSRRGAKVVVISHIDGNTQRGMHGTETLAPVVKALGALVPNAAFCAETLGSAVRAAIRKLTPGNTLVLENLRRARGESENDSSFARELASLADIFIQDAFDTCHRNHASIIGIPKFLPSYAGMLLEDEVCELANAMSPKHPALAIVGGAKFQTKKSVLSFFLKHYDRVFIGGAIANDFLQASGWNVGASFLSGTTDYISVSEILRNEKVALPGDVLTAKYGMPAPSARIAIGGVKREETIVDAGPETSKRLSALVAESRSIIWNGPLGNYENGYSAATESLARVIASSNAYSVVGGGDTVAVIEQLGLLQDFSFVSTGGGAMLEFLANGTLPGIEALGA